MFKFLNFGNNNSSQDDVRDIFNMQGYDAEIEVTVISNKSENKYKIKQKYDKNTNESSQEIIEPESLQGITIKKENNKLILENTQLNLSKIFEEYNIMTQNDMDLEIFIKDFEENVEKSKISENDNEMVLETVSKNDNKYTKNKTLYIDRKTKTPTKMEIKDMNKKITVYIVYTKVEIR